MFQHKRLKYGTMTFTFKSSPEFNLYNMPCVCSSEMHLKISKYNGEEQSGSMQYIPDLHQSQISIKYTTTCMLI